MRFVLVIVALATTSGCISEATLQARRNAELGLERPAWQAVAATRVQRAPVVLEASTCGAIAQRVARDHPRVRARRARVKAAVDRSRAESSLPPPTASVEIWDYPIGDPSRSDREGMYMFGVGQVFPAAGIRDQRALAEAEEAHVALGEAREAASEVWSEVARACVDWSTAELLRARVRSYETLLRELREAMIARYRGGGDTLGSVARADAELAAAERRAAEADEEVEVSRATLVALVGRGFTLPERPLAQPRRAGPLVVEELVELALASRGEVSALAARRRSAVARSRAAEAEADTPTIEVHATYMQAPAARPGLGASFEMSLPWFWGGGGARGASTRSEADAASNERADVERRIRVEVTRAAGQIRALDRSLGILVEREIPASERAVRAERAGLVAGDFTLSSWIQAAHGLREAQIDEARTRGQLARAWIELEASVGQPLQPEPRP